MASVGAFLAGWLQKPGFQPLSHHHSKLKQSKPATPGKTEVAMNAARFRMNMDTVVDKLLRVWTGSWKFPNLPVSRKLQVERGERSQSQTQTLRQT